MGIIPSTLAKFTVRYCPMNTFKPTVQEKQYKNMSEFKYIEIHTHTHAHTYIYVNSQAK